MRRKEVCLSGKFVLSIQSGLGEMYKAQYKTFYRHSFFISLFPNYFFVIVFMFQSITCSTYLKVDKDIKISGCFWPVPFGAM